MLTSTFKSTRHLEKHYKLDFLKDYYEENYSAMKEVLQLYLEETPKDLSQIENALLQNDVAKAKSATHKIKTNIAMLGIVDPADFVSAMHKHGNTSEIEEEVLTLFKIFRSEIIRGLDDIRSDFFPES